MAFKRDLGTFSIVGCDAKQEELGIAVQSRFLAVGSVVPWAMACVGAIATQSWANTTYGPRGLELMASGCSAEETLHRLLDDDPDRQKRQVGIVDARGNSAAYTGKECRPWAGHTTGKGVSCQGNVLVSLDVVRAMAETFESTEGDLATRLLSALEAGEARGGDRRGREAATLLVVKAQAGWGGFNDRYIDLRVDNHPQPIEELKRLLRLHTIHFVKSDPKDLVRVTSGLAKEIQESLKRIGYYQGEVTGLYDKLTREALRSFMTLENLEGRWQEGNKVDRLVLAYMREQMDMAHWI